MIFCEPLWVPIVLELLCSWTGIFASFSRLGKFYTLISSNEFSAPFYLPLPSGSLWCNCLCTWHYPINVLNCPNFWNSFFFILFKSSNFHHSLSVCSSVHLGHLICCWFPHVYFKILTIEISSSVFLLIFSNSLLKSVLTHSSPEFTEHPHDHFLEFC